MFKSVLVGILDPLTRQHTVEYQALDRPSSELKMKLLAFCSNMAITTVPMQIGAVGTADVAEWTTRRHVTIK